MQEVKRIPLKGVHNTRDLGGYTAADGSRIKHCCLIRSGELFDLTKEDKEVLTRDYGLATVVDFRTEAERYERPDPKLDGVNYIVNPILHEKVLGITREKKTDEDAVGRVLKQLGGNEAAGAEYMKNIYSSLLTDSYCKKQYASFFDILLNQEKGAVLWHCTAGKDRAGTGAVLLLSALGIPREQIVADYMKVNEFAAEGIDKMMNKVFQRTGDKRLAEHIHTLFTVQEGYINTLFKIMEEGYGSVWRYLQEEMGLNGDGLITLKDKYLQ
ncbi:protein-tyrosine phosphatase [Kineothrix alysoides]|uniref:Protein-tyrosine phosphatase n=2 Tax=Kineothrix alysoides TaxID=1469948 RepID=A0A4R1QUM1_9FIRM|nr:protein-tyrosine phosphatase [Kineothrix alysoides]